MAERDADQKAEMPEHARRVGGGTAEGNRHARLADTAYNGPTRQPIVVTKESRRLECSNCTAVYGTVRTVVWEDGGGDPASYPRLIYSLWIIGMMCARLFGTRSGSPWPVLAVNP